MLLYIFIWLALVTGLSALYLLVKRAVVLRRTNHNFHTAEPSLHVFVKPTLDYSAFKFITWLKVWLRHTSLQLLMLVAKGLAVVKYLVVKLEQRFAKVIRSVRGQGPTGKRGSVSLFLREVGEIH